MTVRIINADVMDGLRELSDESVHCVVTSPPYWGLRDYGAAGQIGLEPTFAEHLVKLVEVFREVRRVLRKDGTLWLNYGDAYASSGSKGSGGGNNKGNAGAFYDFKGDTGLKPKDLMLMPERLAIALQDDGWWIRSRIIWAKPNPMPESVTDRPTKSHEHIWLMSKAERYYYDADAIRETATYAEPNSPGSITSPYGQGFTRMASMTNEAARPPGTRPHKGIGAKGNANGFRGGSYVGGEPGKRSEVGNVENETLSRNARDVWTIATSPFPEAHFATFPPELAERCIKAGCPADGTVLDPFGGSGTTGLVADRLQRNAILIELNPTYANMAKRRLTNDAPLFAEVFA